MHNDTLSPTLPFLVALLVLTAVPLGHSQPGGGGSVNNTLPSVESFSNSAGPSANAGSTDVFSGTIRDKNGEADLSTLKLTVANAATATTTHDVSVIDWTAVTARPDSYSSNWKAWDAGSGDGTISFEFQYTYGGAGTYEFIVSAADDAGYGASSTMLSIDVVEAILVAQDPVDAAGSALSGTRWGGWAADPGASDVVAGNFLKVTNHGVDDTQSFTIDFTEAVFTGQTDGSWKIGIDSDGVGPNIAFRCAESKTGQPPGVLAWGAWDTTSAGQGAATCAFTSGSANDVGVMYVQYRLASIPEPMRDQAYAATFTVS